MTTVAYVIMTGALVQMQSLRDQIQFHYYLMSQTFYRHFRTVHRTHCLVCLIQNTDPLWFMTL